MTRPGDEFPPLDVTSTLSIGALEDMLDSAGEAEVVPTRLARSLPPGEELPPARIEPSG